MKIRRTLLIIMLGTIVSGMVVSCGDKDDDLGYNGPNNNNNGSNNVDDGSHADNSWMSDEAAHGLEVPAIREGDDIYFVSHYARLNNSGTNTGLNYCLEWDASAFHSRWVAYVFDKTNNMSNVSRTNQWAEDPSLPEAVRLPISGFSGSGYTRGHLCASADRVNSTEANNQTFYMSNMSPQRYDYNGGYWGTLEVIVRNWGRSSKYKALYVCKGGTIRNDQLIGTFTTKNSLGKNVKVVVPKYNFMAILAETNSGTYQAIGFLLEHKDYYDAVTGQNFTSDTKKGGRMAPHELMKQHAMSIDQLEAQTGINFFCNLDDKLENAVESTYNESAWTW